MLGAPSPDPSAGEVWGPELEPGMKPVAPACETRPPRGSWDFGEIAVWAWQGPKRGSPHRPSGARPKGGSGRCLRHPRAAWGAGPLPAGSPRRQLGGGHRAAYLPGGRPPPGGTASPGGKAAQAWSRGTSRRPRGAGRAAAAQERPAPTGKDGGSASPKPGVSLSACFPWKLFR